MGVVSIGNFRLTADDPAYPIPADSLADKTLWLVANTAAAGVGEQKVRVVVTDAGGHTVSDKAYTVGVHAVGVPMPKGSNLVTILPPAGVGPSGARIGFYLG